MFFIEEELKRIDYLYLGIDLFKNKQVLDFFQYLEKYNSLELKVTIFFQNLDEISDALNDKDYFDKFYNQTKTLIQSNRLLLIKTNKITDEFEAVKILTNKFRSMIITNDYKLISDYSSFYKNEHKLIIEPSIFLAFSNQKLEPILENSIKNLSDELKPIFEYRYKYKPILEFIDPSQKANHFSGSELYINNKKVTISSMIKSGSEASIYLSDNGLAFKIYDKRPKTEFLHKKILKMLEYDKFYQGVAWPLSIAKNKEGKFIGYSMSYFSGVRLAQLLTGDNIAFNHLSRLQKNRLSIKICGSLTETLLALHRQNILVGDINANNILVNFDGQVFLVDTDSFQFGYYPSQMGTKLYYSPEFKQVNKTNYLRSFGTESYSIGFLLSRIISTPNIIIKPHKYFQQTIDSIVDSIYLNNFYQEKDALQFIIKHIDSLFKSLPDYRYTTAYYKEIVKMYSLIINNLI